MSSFASNNRVQSTTRAKLMPKVVDSILNSNVFAARMLRSAKKWSGAQMKFPVKYQKNATFSSFSGFDSLSTAASDTRVNASFDPSFASIAVSLPLDEMSVNMASSKEEAILDLAATELKSSAQDMADSVGSLFYADGTGNSSKDFLGLGAAVDDGTSVATYGGLSRSTYTTWAATKTASSGTLSIAKMATLWNAITSGSVKPNVGFTTEAIFSLYEQLLQPQERINKSADMSKGLKGGTGFTGLDYKGIPILADEKCTSGILYFLNEEFINWYALPVAETDPVKFKSVDIEGNDYSSVEGLGFSWSGWVKPTNQAALIGHIYLGGQLICDNPKRQGALTGVTSV